MGQGGFVLLSSDGSNVSVCFRLEWFEQRLRVEQTQWYLTIGVKRHFTANYL